MATLLRANRVELANLAAREMGKPVSQGRAEVEKCASLCAWCAEHGPSIIADESTQVGPQAYVSYLPIGIVLGIMPWNFPFWQAMRGAAGILFGGNGYVLKHAPNVMGCAYMLKGLWEEAGLPEGAFTVLNVRPEAIASVISDDRIAAVAVTGSVRAGASIASLSGASIKKTVLELGGSDPFIVLRDADIDRAVEAAVAARFQNTGQVCIAAKRIILDGSIAEEFTALFLMAVANLIVGDPMSEKTFIGPMARTDLRDELHLQVEKSISEGANMLLGGQKWLGAGNYYTPTVLGDVRPGMTAFREETFGPVASLIIAQDADDAVRLANDSEFGLSASIWSRDSAGAKALARRIHTGGVFINGYGASDPRVPIGGVKRSGYGRELSHFGIKEFLNAQTVWLDRR
jgi:succinate-semialdehyde dehydrogenase